MLIWDHDTETPVQPIPECALCRALAAPAFAWPRCAEPVRLPHLAPVPFARHIDRVCRDCAHTLGVTP